MALFNGLSVIGIDEAELSRQATRIVERHAADAGLDISAALYEDMSSWLLFSLFLHRITFPMLDADEPPAWVEGLFAELGPFIATNATSEFSDYYLGMMLKPFHPECRKLDWKLTKDRYARLCARLGVPSEAAEQVILANLADEEWRESQMGY